MLKKNIFFIILGVLILTFNTPKIIPNPTEQFFQNPEFTDLKNKKSWTIMIYIAAANDLDIFAAANIKQMEAIGSTDTINIIIQLHTNSEKTKKTVKTFYIKKKQSILLAQQEYLQEKQTTPNLTTITSPKESINENKSVMQNLFKTNNLDSGNPQNLITFCTGAIESFPAEHYALILWNHGTGPLDPIKKKPSTITQIFSLLHSNLHAKNEHSKPSKKIIATKLQQNNTLKKQQTSQKQQQILIKKAICFDDFSHNFLSDTDLQIALKTITKKALNHKKIDLIGFDACLMGMVEIAYTLHPYANYMVCSQESELGPGWNYTQLFAPFTLGTITPKTLARHIVTSYSKRYATKPDYTLSALDLELLNTLQKNISTLALILIKMLKMQQADSVRDMLRISRDKHLCTHFDQPDFIDLHHFYENLLLAYNNIKLVKEKEAEDLLIIYKQTLLDGCDCIEKIVIHNKTGSHHKKAKGLSIYFPEHKIHHSYYKTIFAEHSAWITLLTAYFNR